MNESKNKNLFIRVSEKEKTIIEQNAKKCGLSVSEYLRQRALGYMPRAVLPEIFFSFNDKLDELCVAVEGKITADTEEKIIALIDGITAELILPQKEKVVLCQEKVQIKSERFCCFLLFHSIFVYPPSCFS